MQSITYIISDIGKALAFEWIAEKLDKQLFQLSFILLNPGPSELEDFLKERGIPVYRVNCRGKKDWPMAWLQTYRLLRKLKPLTVHCHLLQANIIGLSAAKAAGIKARIYTRHHSSLHHVYHKKGIFWDKIANRQATKIVAISGVVKKILLEWEKADPAKVVVIPHGFELSVFEKAAPERIHAFRQRHQLEADQETIGVISRFTEWKGVQYIIQAFIAYHKAHPDTVLLLLNAKGDYEKELLELLKHLPATAYRLITFESDISAAYHSMSIFVHTPVDEHSEAFGQIYVEALVARIPSVFTLSGIAPDFIHDGKNALVVPFRDATAIAVALETLHGNEMLRANFKSNGYGDVCERFSIDTMIAALMQLYKDNLTNTQPKC